MRSGFNLFDVIVPVLHRPQNVKRLMDSFVAAGGRGSAVTFVAEPDDLEEQDAVIAAEACLLLFSGTFARKVNFAYKHTRRPWLLPVGDDVVFHEDWDSYVLAAAEAQGALVIGTNDGGCDPRNSAGEHSGHLAVSRAYVDEQGSSWDGPGTVCHEQYFHNYVDDEIVTVAKQRGVWGFAHEAVVEHLHPNAGKAPVDAGYTLGYSRASDDWFRFNRRKEMYAPEPF